jgi:hypothetical protein
MSLGFQSGPQGCHIPSKDGRMNVVYSIGKDWTTQAFIYGLIFKNLNVNLLLTDS